MKNSFTEDDKQKFINFLNAVANHAKFELNTQELCEYFRLLAHMQQVMLPKINDNILEIIKTGVFDQEKYNADQAEKTKTKTKAK